MAVRRLRKKQRGPWCSYCPEKTERAIHRGCGFRKFACAEHLEKLTNEDETQAARDNHQSDAEFQLGM